MGKQEGEVCGRGVAELAPPPRHGLQRCWMVPTCGTAMHAKIRLASVWGSRSWNQIRCWPAQLRAQGPATTSCSGERRRRRWCPRAPYRAMPVTAENRSAHELPTAVGLTEAAALTAGHALGPPARQPGHWCCGTAPLFVGDSGSRLERRHGRPTSLQQAARRPSVDVGSSVQRPPVAGVRRGLAVWQDLPGELSSPGKNYSDPSQGSMHGAWRPPSPAVMMFIREAQTGASITAPLPLPSATSPANLDRSGLADW